MAIRVVTLDREYGCGGGAIAAKLAARLGWQLWDQLLTEEIARRLGCECRAVEEREEKRDPIYYRLLKAFMKGSYEGSLNAPHLNLVDTECIREVTQKLLPEIVDTGNCVIVGRGSSYFLSAWPDVFHVFVYAPFDERVRRLRHGNGFRRCRWLYLPMDPGPWWWSRNGHGHRQQLDMDRQCHCVQAELNP